MACKVKNEKEKEDSLMAFSLQTIIPPIEGKKYLTT